MRDKYTLSFKQYVLEGGNENENDRHHVRVVSELCTHEFMAEGQDAALIVAGRILKNRTLVYRDKSYPCDPLYLRVDIDISSWRLAKVT